MPSTTDQAILGGVALPIDTGLSPESREKISRGLSRLLADSYVLYLKTHNFHWNVTGPLFQSLHELFEVQYTELATAIDEIAERIRALGVAAPGSWKQFQELTSIEEETGVPTAEEMIRQLVVGQETVARTARETLPSATDVNDEASVDLLTQRLHRHEKNAWMLRSMVG
ncbi:MAG: Dps family protein [Acidobacteriota bacterium]